MSDWRATLRALALRAIAGAVTSPPIAQPPVVGQERVLLIRPDHLGDILLATPAIHALREARPGAHLTALVGPWGAPLLSGSPDLDALLTLPFPWFDRQPRQRFIDPYQRLYAALPMLRGRFDIAVILRFDHWWGGWLAAAAGIPRRIGYATPQLLPFLTEALPYDPAPHEAIQNFGLTARLGTPATATPEAAPLRLPPPSVGDLEAATRLVGEGGTGPLVALHPGSGAAVKAWPVARWAALARFLVTVHGARLLLTGAPGGERELAEAVVAAAGVPARVVAGETTLPILAALFRQCDLVIGPDTGPLHLAVAAGVPTVHLYGPVSPVRFGPWGPPERHPVISQALACQPCQRLDWSPAELPHHPCVTDIPVAWVAAAASKLLQPATG